MPPPPSVEMATPAANTPANDKAAIAARLFRGESNRSLVTTCFVVKLEPTVDMPISH